LGCGRRDYKERGRLSAMDDVGFVELVLNAEWYIWWERREKVHGENTPPSQFIRLTCIPRSLF
jgi:hypothetical protein